MDEGDRKALSDIEEFGCHVLKVMEGDDFDVLQMIWPTTDGLWPWFNDTSEFYRWAQPILNETGELSEI
ncbi:MAG: hypothetical protein ABJK37_03245 [Paraglaciecola sp.]|uniref:hypothetical protein n=1 Tax=Paraglaciecola sp. TaxID=1920173 RepID=UPI00329A52BD